MDTRTAHMAQKLTLLNRLIGVCGDLFVKHMRQTVRRVRALSIHCWITSILPGSEISYVNYSAIWVEKMELRVNGAYVLTNPSEFTIKEEGSGTIAFAFLNLKHHQFNIVQFI